MKRIARKTQILSTIAMLSAAALLSGCQPPQGFKQNRPLTSLEQKTIEQAIIPAMNRLSSLDGMSEISGGDSSAIASKKVFPAEPKTSEPQESPFQLGLQCEKQICTSTKTIKDLLDSENANIENVDLTRSLVSLINSKYKSEVDAFSSNIKSLWKTTFRFQPKVSSEAQDLIYLNYLMALFKKLPAYIGIDNSTGNLIFDFEKYSAELNNGVIKTELQITKFDAEGINLILKSNAVDLILRGISFSDLLRASIKVNPEAGSLQRIAFFKAVQFEKAFNKMYSVLKIKPILSSALKKALQMQELNESDMKTLMQDFLNSELADLALNGELSKSASRSRFFESPAFKKITSMSPEQISKSFTEKIELRQKYCSINVARSLVLSPTDDQMLDLKKTAELVRGIAHAELTSTIKNKNALIGAVEKVQQTEFSYPETKKSVANALSVFLNEKIQSQNSYTSIESQWVQFVQNSTDVVLGTDPQELAAEAASECSIFAQALFTDSTRTSLGRISVSASTAQDTKIGLSIIAHELGHVVSAALRGRNELAKKVDIPFLDQKSEQDFKCVLNRINDSELYLEESFADNFSSRIVKRLQNSEYTKNMGCFLDLNFGNGIPSLINTDPTDTHPAHFLRALSVHQDLYGSLPPVCSGFLESQGFKQFRTCPAL